MSLSTGDSICTAETASTRRVEKVTASHLFKIMEHSLEQDIGKGIFHESATFNVGGYDWSILYYPNGSLTAEDDYISICIFLKSEAEYVKARTSFIICNQDGNPLAASQTTSVYTFGEKHEDFGFRNFLKRSAFESVLKDDCRVIRCTVTVFKVFPVEPNFPLLVPPPLDIQQLISHLLEAGYGADVTFEVKGQTFNAHKCILAMRSQVFQAQFFRPLKEKSDTVIGIEDIEAPVFKSLLHFIYSETIPELEEINESKKNNTNLMAQHLLVAADRYGLERLRIICEKILYGSIDKSNVVTLLSLAEMHSCIHLKGACLKFLASTEIISEVLATEQRKVSP